MKILIFAGTTEGRLLSEELADAGHDVTVSVATEYGEHEQGEHAGVSVLCGRKTTEQIADLLKDFEVCIDATHPYAVEVSENIREACDRLGSEDGPSENVCKSDESESGSSDIREMKEDQSEEREGELGQRPVRYYRLLRPESVYPADTIFVQSAGEAADYLSRTEGNILLTTGAKELPAYAELEGERLYPRVLPLGSSLKSCEEAGIPSRNIIAMQGPFSEELNLALLHSLSIRYMVTKDGGATGGFPEKIQAAQKAGVSVILIARPGEEGMTYGEIRKALG